ncbi:MAG: MauE/DoxX family redox-associated membrane protein [Actinomycetota bacterium]
MDVAILAVRIGLALVLMVSGVAKLLDRRSTRQVVPALGIPETLAGAIAVVLPIVELGVGLLLVPVATARAAALAATLLFACFSIVVGVALARGRRPDCHCFGQLSPGPIGSSTLVRSGLLACGAAFVALGWVEPPLGLLGWLQTLSSPDRAFLAADALILLGMAALGYAAQRLLLQQRRILQRLDDLEALSAPSTTPAAPHGGLAVGASAPRFSLRRADGTPGSLDALLRRGRPVLLLFLNPRCVPCEMLLPEVARWSRDDASVFTIGVVSRGDLGENLRMSARSGSASVLVQRDTEVDDAYEVTGTPAAVVIGVDGRVSSPLAISAREIKTLVMSIGGSAKPVAELGHDHVHSHAGGA